MMYGYTYGCIYKYSHKPILFIHKKKLLICANKGESGGLWLDEISQIKSIYIYVCVFFRFQTCIRLYMYQIKQTHTYTENLLIHRINNRMVIARGRIWGWLNE